MFSNLINIFIRQNKHKAVCNTVQAYFDRCKEYGSFQEFLGLTAILCIKSPHAIRDIWQKTLILILRNWHSKLEPGVSFWYATDVLLSVTKLVSLQYQHTINNNDFWLLIPEWVDELPNELRSLTRIYMITVGVFETINYHLSYEAPVTVSYSIELLKQLLRYGDLNIAWKKCLTSPVLDSLIQHVINVNHCNAEQARKEVLKLPFIPTDMRIGIQEYSIFDNVEILGHTFAGLKDIKECVELSLYEGDSTADIKKEYKPLDNIHVGEMWAPYPCFDSSDSLYENRTYENFIFRSKPITQEDLQKLYKLPIKDNHGRVSEKVPSEMLPIVYYSGDDNIMLVLTNL